MVFRLLSHVNFRPLCITGFCDGNKLIFTLPRKGKGLEKRNAKSLAPPALSCHIGDNVGLSSSSCVRSFRSAPSARVIFHGFPLSAAVAAEDDLEEERTTAKSRRRRRHSFSLQSNTPLHCPRRPSLLLAFRSPNLRQCLFTFCCVVVVRPVPVALSGGKRRSVQYRQNVFKV